MYQKRHEMKAYSFIIAAVIIITTAFLLPTNSSTPLITGDLIFTSISGSSTDGFSIRTTTNIAPFTSVHFTDSEWTGNRFGADESNITWSSGEKTIPAGTTVSFNAIDSFPNLSHGSLTGTLKISEESDAIFAYTGTHRMPSQFIAATANEPKAYGTLLNTGLIEGASAITITNEPSRKNAHTIDLTGARVSKPLLPNF